jgi:UDP-N-acetylmuramoyl-L-alanyl-D-glutamate--2,6-diaminopimelate ligase
VVLDVVDDDRAPQLDGDDVLFASRPSRSPRPDSARREADSLREAVRRGAVAVMVGPRVDVTHLGVPALRVPDVHTALGPCSAAVHGHPSRRLPIVMVTGTDGKTTTTFMASAAISRVLGRGVGMLTTIHSQIGGELAPSTLTTPEAPAIQRSLRRILDAGDGAAVLEASSIALVQHRLHGVEGRIGVFTNLTPEHLDVHGDMDTYFRAKELLFIGGFVKSGVINVDTDAGRRMAASASGAGVRVVSVSPSGSDTRADVALVQRTGPQSATIRVGPTTWDLSLAMPGAHNVANALCAVGVALELGLDPAEAIAGIADLPGVPGRLERITDPEGLISAYVDYAHTPAALAVAIQACREVATATGGRLFVLAGCGGDRDQHKRQPMGQVVAAGADLAIFTSDNPRSEDPEVIAKAMLAGLDRAQLARVRVDLDRRIAIRRAIEDAREGDVVLVAGKGHEREQVKATGRESFDDRAEVATALANRSHVESSDSHATELSR